MLLLFFKSLGPDVPDTLSIICQVTVPRRVRSWSLASRSRSFTIPSRIRSIEVEC